MGCFFSSDDCFCSSWMSKKNNDLYPVSFRFVEYRFPCNGKRTKKPDIVHDQCGSNGLSIVARIHSYSISSRLGISWLALHYWTAVGRFKYVNIAKGQMSRYLNLVFFKSPCTWPSALMQQKHMYSYENNPLCHLNTFENNADCQLYHTYST